MDQEISTNTVDTNIKLQDFMDHIKIIKKELKKYYEIQF